MQDMDMDCTLALHIQAKVISAKGKAEKDTSSLLLSYS